MCDAFLKMRPFSDRDKVSATIRYASSLTKKIGQVENIEMGANHFLVMDELAKIYRNKTMIQNTTLKGIIRSLTRKTDIGHDLQTIQLYTIFNGLQRTITIVLSPQQYHIACDAHRDGLEIEISGKLDMSKRHWMMTEITHFLPLS